MKLNAHGTLLRDVDARRMKVKPDNKKTKDKRMLHAKTSKL